VPDRHVFSPQTSWLVMDMLSDPEARRPGFGMELPFDLPFRIAAKTGTARGFADTWAVGATREAIVGAWAGTFDGSPMQGIVGMDAAAPLVRDAMLAVSAEAGRPLTLPARPAGIDDVEVCADTGMPADDHCPRIADHVAHGYVPRDPGITRDERGALHYPSRADGWLRRTGRLAER
jgi:penicillin-binding protein 1C